MTSQAEQLNLYPQSDLARRSALVTGGGTGIGWAIARQLADEGYQVTVAGLQSDLGSENTEHGSRFDFRILDVTDSGSIARLVAQLSRLDVLVNCAGTIVRGGLEHDPHVFAEVVDVNLNGTLRMSQACFPLLRIQRGCVLNIASMLSIFGSGRVPAYSASKGGIVQLTKSLAIAWAADGVRVNAIAPGWIKTNLTAPLVESTEFSSAIIARTPLGRWGVPEDVAPAAAFLCSSKAAFITGTVLTVDGGYSVV